MKTLNIYLLNGVDCDYDGYDSIVVFALTPKEAKTIAATRCDRSNNTSFLKAKCKKIGVSTKKNAVPGVILVSFNAG